MKTTKKPKSCRRNWGRKQGCYDEIDGNKTVKKLHQILIQFVLQTQRKKYSLKQMQNH